MTTADKITVLIRIARSARADLKQAEQQWGEFHQITDYRRGYAQATAYAAQLMTEGRRTVEIPRVFKIEDYRLPAPASAGP